MLVCLNRFTVEQLITYNYLIDIMVLKYIIFSAPVCSRCNNRCDKSERTDKAFRELVLREKCLIRKLALKEQEILDYAVSIGHILYYCYVEEFNCFVIIVN